MENKVKEILEKYKVKGAKQQLIAEELCVLFGVSNRLSEIREKGVINAEAWALIHDNEDVQKGIIKGVKYGLDYVVNHFK